MGILISKDFTDSLISDITASTNKISIISAFCKVETLKYLDNYISDNVTKRILIRFRLEDLLSKATDLELYDYCVQNSWELFINLDLHAKIYCVDDICYIGSANMTDSGLSIGKIGNIEGTKRFIIEDQKDKFTIDRLFVSSRKLDEELYEKMKNKLYSIEPRKIKKEIWSKNIIDEYNQVYNVLFQEDFPLNNSPLNLEYDEQYLGIYKEDLKDMIKRKFEDTKIMKWLLSVLLEKENNEIYFGELSEKIHSIIFQEPKQYRKDVKELQVKLYNWLKELNYDYLLIDAPNYSTRIKLVKRNQDNFPEY